MEALGDRGDVGDVFGQIGSDGIADPAEIERLYAKIGQLLVERDFLRDASVRLGLIRDGK